MSHRSRLYSAYVDVPRQHLESAVRFYGDLLGKTATIDADDPDYASFGEAETGIELYVQASRQRRASRPPRHRD